MYPTLIIVHVPFHAAKSICIAIVPYPLRPHNALTSNNHHYYLFLNKINLSKLTFFPYFFNKQNFHPNQNLSKQSQSLLTHFFSNYKKFKQNYTLLLLFSVFW